MGPSEGRGQASWLGTGLYPSVHPNALLGSMGSRQHPLHLGDGGYWGLTGHLHLPSITKERTEVILQGTVNPNASAPDAVWEDYEFKCKPGDPWRRPCLISPYHYRLDWLMWFAAFQVPACHKPLHTGKPCMPAVCKGRSDSHQEGGSLWRGPLLRVASRPRH